MYVCMCMSVLGVRDFNRPRRYNKDKTRQGRRSSFIKFKPIVYKKFKEVKQYKLFYYEDDMTR